MSKALNLICRRVACSAEDEDGSGCENCEDTGNPSKQDAPVAERRTCRPRLRNGRILIWGTPLRKEGCRPTSQSFTLGLMILRNQYGTPPRGMRKSRPVTWRNGRRPGSRPAVESLRAEPGETAPELQAAPAASRSALKRKMNYYAGTCPFPQSRV